MRISQKTIDEIFDIAIIEDVISEFVVLKKTGANYKGLSPFNDEKTPSFVVSPSKEIWKDFSSGKGGNVISFLMEHEQYTYPESLLFLAKKYNIDVEYIELDERAQKEKNKREAILIVLKFTKTFFCKNLTDSDKTGFNYLKTRGFSESTMKTFEIGYCSENDKSLIKEIKTAGYNLDYLKESRIINENQKNRFSGRLIFPIHNITGQVVGFGGRILKNNVKGVKYLNSDSSDLYQKSKILYALFLAKKHIKKLDSCYVVEGYTDVMALHLIGIKNVVSNCGTAFTKDQIRLINRFTNTIIILFDSDNAGVNATLQAIDSILEQNMMPQVLQLPDSEDPASFVAKNKANDIIEYITEKPVDFIEFKYSLIKEDETSDLIKITHSILESLLLIEHQISQTFYVRRASQVLKIKEEDLLVELNKIKSKKNKTQKSINTVKQKKELFDFFKIKKENLEEFQLMRLLINYGTSEDIKDNQQSISVGAFIAQELENDSIGFSFSMFDKIFKDILEKIKLGVIINKGYFLTHSDDTIREFAAYVLGEKHLLSNWQEKDIFVLEEKDILYKVARESILRFKLKRVQEMVKNSLSALKDDNGEEEDKLKQFSRLSGLEKKIQQELGRLF